MPSSHISQLARILICLSLTLPILAASTPTTTACPTVTKTTHRANCPPPTPSLCAQPQCILLSMLDVPCGCPTAVPTHTSYTACPKHCTGSCGTTFRTNLESCPTSSPTSVSNTCYTKTITSGPSCPAQNCVTADCILAKTITLECGCPSIYTTTSCKTTCDGACGTSYSTAYLPCPFTTVAA